jgi:hypothetical protein
MSKVGVFEEGNEALPKNLLFQTGISDIIKRENIILFLVMDIGQEHQFRINGYSQVIAKTIFKRKYPQITQQYHFWYQDLQVQS